MGLEVITGFHDAELKCIDSSDAPERINFSFISVDGQKKLLTLYGCELFRATDFISQNVVSRLLIFRGRDVDTQSVVEKLHWASSLSDSSSSLNKEWLESVVEKIRGDELSVFALESSWGAEVVVLFERMTPQKNLISK